MIDKVLLKKRFLRALFNYEKEAIIQRKMAQDLLKALSFKDFYSRVLEIGAGTGLFTRKFVRSYRFDLYLASDLLPACSLFFKELPVYFLALDGESPPFKAESFSLIVSNATFQWFLKPQESFLAFERLLIPEGILAFTSFGPETMKELGPKEKPAGLLKIEEILSLKPPGFDILETQIVKRVLYFENSREALKHIRNTGAMGYLKSCWSLPEIKKWSQKYETLRTEKGLPLTFESILVVWRKKA